MIIDDSKKVIENIEYIFDCANEYYFENALEKPIFGLTETKDSYGHISVGSYWHNKESKGMRELNINPNYLDRPTIEIIKTILHEMAHLDNIMKKINDCSGYYHNKKFKEAAERLDLEVVKDSRYGYCITKPTVQTSLFKLEYRIDDFFITRKKSWYMPITTGSKGKETKEGEKGNEEGKKAKKPSSTRKYQCRNCGNSVRATKDLSVICGDCYTNHKMLWKMQLCD